MKGVQTDGSVYAQEVYPIRTTSIGGLCIDSESRVLDNNDRPITGLYAAGEVATATYYYDVYVACGTLVGFALTYGKIAGINAAEDAGYAMN